MPDLTLALTPNCPRCGEPPVLALGGQSFCDTDDCQTLAWNPLISREENLATAHVVDLTGFPYIGDDE